jgi:hypothetical protein
MAKYPGIVVSPLPGQFNIFGTVNRIVGALKEAQVSAEDVEACRVDIMSSAPSYVPTVIKRWVVYT